MKKSPPTSPACDNAAAMATVTSANAILHQELNLADIAVPQRQHLCTVPNKMGLPLAQVPSGSSFLKESFRQVHLSGRAQISCM